MFTIKQVLHSDDDPIHSVGCIVRLWTGSNIHSFINENTGELNVGFTMQSTGTCTIDSGTVYVMNEAGKTVETFQLKQSVRNLSVPVPGNYTKNVSSGPLQFWLSVPFDGIGE